MGFTRVLFGVLPKLAKERKPNYDEYEAAAERMIHAIKTGEIELPKKWTPELEEAFGRVFLAERFIMARAANPYITRRIAVAYSKAFSSQADDKEVEEMAKALHLRFRTVRNDENESADKHKRVHMHVVDFLKHAPESPDYSLFYFSLENGEVEMSWRRFARIVEEALKNLLSTQPKSQDKDAEDFAKRVKESLPKRRVRFSTKNQGAFPPCIKALLKRIEQHENLGHSARWVLAVYLVNKGYSVDEIVKVYEPLPDFKERITRYQVEHIKKRRYTMPSCDKIRGYGLCVQNCGIKNPMQYGRRRKNGKDRRES